MYKMIEKFMYRIERHAEGNTREKELIGTEWKEI